MSPYISFKGEVTCVCLWGGGGVLEIFGETLKKAELSLISGMKKHPNFLSS